MGWFDEQIKQRIQNDDEAFYDAFSELAQVVMGEKLAKKLKDRKTQTKTAIDEILKYYHIKSRVVPDNISDINEQLEYLMRPSGYMRRYVSLKGEWYKDASGVMLGTKKDGTPIALFPKKFLGYHYFDPDTRRYIDINKKNVNYISTEAICIYEPLPNKFTSKDLWKYIISFISKYDIMAILALSLIVSLIGLIIPKINEIIYSDVVFTNNIALLLSIFTLYASAYVSKIILSAVSELFVERIGTRISNYLQTSVMMRMLSLPISFFRKHSVGELTNSLIYIGQSSKLLIRIVLITIISIISCVVYIAQMSSYSISLVKYAILILLISIIIYFLGMRKEKNIFKKILQAEGKEESFVYSLIRGIQKIRLSGAEKRVFFNWATKYKEVLENKYKIPFIVKIYKIIPMCITLVSMLVLYFFAIKENISVSNYFAFNSGFGIVLGTLMIFIQNGSLFSKILPILENVNFILEEETEMSENRGVITRISGGIELNNVYFRYNENMPPILDKLSLKIRPGQYVAIVGSSGCGKTTLMRIMLGFEKPQKGAVYYDGRDISNIDVKSLRKHIGVVTQNEKLFPGDIFSNIAISNTNLTMEDAWTAVKMAGAEDDIKQMPMGMYSLISENNEGMSGGQRQRIIIARAIASKPKILMFDEATSALDNITQKIVSDSLASLKCTRIIIAHRLSTIKQCDRILVLNEGKIIADGTYDELLEKSEFFSQLVDRQKI